MNSFEHIYVVSRFVAHNVVLLLYPNVRPFPREGGHVPLALGSRLPGHPGGGTFIF